MKIQKAMHSVLQECCRWPFQNVFTGQQALSPSCCQWWVNSLYQLRSPGTCPGLTGASLLRCLRRLPNLHHRRHSHAFPSTPNMWSVADWHEDPRAWPFTLTVRSDAVHWYLNYKLSPKSGQWPHPGLAFCFLILLVSLPHKVSWGLLPVQHVQPYSSLPVSL